MASNQGVGGSSPSGRTTYYMEIKPSNIPSEVLAVVETLEAAGHEAYIVGGCVRDLLLGRKPKDWDVTTNATPEVIQSL